MKDRAETTVLYSENKVNIRPSNLKSEKRWGKLLILVGIATTIGSAIPVGYNIGVINNPSSYMRTWCNQTFLEEYNIQLSVSTLDILWSTIVSIFLVGGAVGSLGGAWVADKFGRKSSFLITGLLFLIGAILFQFCRTASSVIMLMLGRFIVGLASGLCTTTLPMYLIELAPLMIRGTIGTFCAIGVTGGVVVGQVFSLRHIFGTELLWHYSLSAYIILVLICYAPSYYYPESPKYLYIVRGDREGARKELLRLRGNNLQIIDRELDEMENYKNTTTATTSFFSVLRNPALMMPLIIVAAYMGGQQLSGINAIFYYSVSIFESAGLSTSDAEWANLGAGCINLFTSLFGPILMSKFNRRPLMIFSCALDAILLFSIAFIINFINSASWLPIACIVAILLYIFFYQFGLGPIPYFIGSELFETDPRPIAMSIGSLSSWVCNFIIAMTFPSLQRAWGAFVFIPFSITCALLVILTKLYLPETRNRDPSEVAPLIARGFRSKPLQ